MIHADLFQTGNTMAALIAQQITYIENNAQKHAIYYLALILLVIGVVTNLIARWIARRYSAGGPDGHRSHPRRRRVRRLRSDRATGRDRQPAASADDLTRGPGL